MRTSTRTPRRWSFLLACLCSALVLTGCSSSGPSPDGEGTQPRGSGDAAAVPSAPPSGLRYVALGDSYVSAPLVPVTDVASGCFRSTANYPSIVAKKLGATLEDRSCGGAETSDFLTSQYPDVPPQLQAVKKNTDVVTVGVGGNDQKVFARLTGRCPALRASDPDGAPCQQAMDQDGQDALLTDIAKAEEKVAALLREIHRRAPKAQVLVVGYPQIVDADDACSELPLARGDYPYAEKVNFALTEMLRRAAEATDSTYVDVWSASKGHDICSDDPWINGSVDDEQAAARYHPFANEQAAVAELVLTRIRTPAAS